MSDDADALHQRGLASLRQGARESARADFLEALRIDPRRGKTAANLARLALEDAEVGTPSARDALRYAELASAIEPLEPRYRTLVGRALLANGRPADAVRILEAVVATAPSSAEAWAALALAARSAGGAHAERASLERAVLAIPTDARLWNNLGGVCRRAADGARALAAYERAHELAPDDLTVLGNLTSECTGQGRLARAEQLIQHARAIGAADDDVMLALELNLLQSTLRPVESAALARRVLERDARTLRFRSHAVALFNLSYLDEITPVELLTHARRWAMRWCTLDASDTDENSRRFRRMDAAATNHGASRAPRIGYLSSDFRNHVVARFMRPILESHRARGLDVRVLSTTTEPDAWTRDFERDFQLIQLDLDDLDGSTRRLRAMDLDVVVELAGHTDTRVLRLFRRRIAPVQLTYLGFPSTTGLDAFDGRITDIEADPAGSEAQYTEPLQRLDRCAWAYVPTELPPIQERPSDEPFRFASFNRIEKLSPTILGAWRAILEGAPAARLRLRSRALEEPSVRERVLAHFPPDVRPRLEFASWVHDERNAILGYGDIDVALDSFPYHGTTTTCDALWMGVPVVSWQGEWSASRVGGSLLAAVGLRDLAVSSREAYVAKAIELANDTPRRADFRRRAREILASSVLGDPAGLAASLEDLYARLTTRARERPSW
jgi:protein O-GlcNAc transferase